MQKLNTTNQLILAIIFRIGIPKSCKFLKSALEVSKSIQSPFVSKIFLTMLLQENLLNQFEKNNFSPLLKEKSMFSSNNSKNEYSYSEGIENNAVPFKIEYLNNSIDKNEEFNLLEKDFTFRTSKNDFKKIAPNIKINLLKDIKNMGSPMLLDLSQRSKVPLLRINSYCSFPKSKSNNESKYTPFSIESSMTVEKSPINEKLLITSMIQGQYSIEPSFSMKEQPISLKKRNSF